MPRARKGEAVSESRRTPEARSLLERFRVEAERAEDLGAWRRAQAVLRYIDGVPAAQIAEQLGVDRSSVSRWLIWYEEEGAGSLRTRQGGGTPGRLTVEQTSRLIETLKAGPQAAGFTGGMWTGPMVRDYVEREFGVRYHVKHLPRLLRQLGFSVQRPRKRLARADPEAQRVWIEERLPEIKKKVTMPGA